MIMSWGTFRTWIIMHMWEHTLINVWNCFTWVGEGDFFCLQIWLVDSFLYTSLVMAKIKHHRNENQNRKHTKYIILHLADGQYIFIYLFSVLLVVGLCDTTIVSAGVWKLGCGCSTHVQPLPVSYIQYQKTLNHCKSLDRSSSLGRSHLRFTVCRPRRSSEKCQLIFLNVVKRSFLPSFQVIKREGAKAWSISPNATITEAYAQAHIIFNIYIFKIYIWTFTCACKVWFHPRSFEFCVVWGMTSLCFFFSFFFLSFMLHYFFFFLLNIFFSLLQSLYFIERETKNIYKKNKFLFCWL